MMVVRPDDLLLLRLRFTNVERTPGSGGAPATITGGPDAILVVQFQPQHIAEQAFWEMGTTKQTKEEIAAGQAALPPSGDSLPAPGNVGARLAGYSRLAFRIPATVTFNLTLEDVLDALTRLPLNVSAAARYEPNPGCANVPLAFLPILGQPSPPPIIAPARDETAIEAPYRLFLSPDNQAQWSHVTAKKADAEGRVELWHTRLGSHRPNGDPRVRAVWSRDYDKTLQGHKNDPFRSALDGRDRNEIVQLTANYYLPDFTPSPLHTERLMLTTLGAWLDLEGNWEPPSLPGGGSLTVEQWRHIATMARDHYVRVVYAGYLLPFGHRASLVKITERKLIKPKEPPLPGFVAYSMQRMFILVREPERTYSERDMPLRRVRIVTRATPDLAKPEESDVASLTQEAFWPRIAPGGAGTEFQFHLIGTDWQERDSEFTAPLMFVSKNVDEGATVNTFPAIDVVIAAYNSAAPDSLRTRPFLGQKVAFAPPLKPDDTSLETVSVAFEAERVETKPHFRPLMSHAEVAIPAVKALAGPTASSTIEFEKGFVDGPGNPADVFVTATNGDVTFDHETSGGLATPNVSVKGISRSLGPIGDAAMIAGSFDPKAIFKSIKILGGISLADIIHEIAAGTDLAADDNVPRLLTARDGNIIRTTYHYRVDEKHLSGGNILKVRKGEKGELLLEAVAETPIGGGAPKFHTDGHLTNFDLVLLPKDDFPGFELVQLNFNSVSFHAEAGQKLDTAVDLRGITFVGILEFVNTLQKFIPLDGFSDPPSVELVSSPHPGVNVGFSLGLPTIGIGIMTMQNVSLSAGFYLPFVDEPMNFRFAFCERQQPFTLTVSLFGGGGFFGLNVGLGGVKSIEASLEFGASIALNLGVASGQATIMAGFYMQIGEKGLFILTGYFRACGSLSVLGIITVSVEFYLGLTYAAKPQEGEPQPPHAGHLWGQATLTVKIKILFFSKSVGISMEREFAGSDPTFAELMPFDAWGSYCGAFDDYLVGAGD